MVVSPELNDVLNKLLRNDEENGSGDVQMLCELFSGERTSYRFATESTREIPGSIPFGILSLVLTSDAGARITTYASAVSTSWSIDHFVFPKFRSTHSP